MSVRRRQPTASAPSSHTDPHTATHPSAIASLRPIQRPRITALPTPSVDPYPHVAAAPEALTMAHKALYKVSEAMVLLSMSRTVIYEQIRAGRLRTVTQGRARLVPKGAIAEYVALLGVYVTHFVIQRVKEAVSNDRHGL